MFRPAKISPLMLILLPVACGLFLAPRNASAIYWVSVSPGPPVLLPSGSDAACPAAPGTTAPPGWTSAAPGLSAGGDFGRGGDTGDHSPGHRPPPGSQPDLPPPQGSPPLPPAEVPEPESLLLLGVVLSAFALAARRARRA